MKYFYLFCALGFALSANARVLINEIHSNPDIDTDLVKFIELYNDGNSPIDLSGWKFSKAIDFAFPNGASIAAGGYLVVAENPAALQSKYGASSLGPWTGNLSAQGDDIVLLDPSGKVENEVEYQAGFPWPTVGGAPGFSMELVNPQFDNTLGGNWRPSVNADFIPPSQSTLVPIDQIWKYEQSGTDLGTAWLAPGYDDAAWPSGPALLYHEDATLPAPKNTSLTGYAQSKSAYYFRTHFSFSGDPALTSLAVQTVVDDGAVIYLNGHELTRVGMPGGAISYSSFANRTVGDASYEGPIPVPSTWLTAGDNVLAVEVHQANLQSSDIVWGMTLTAATSSGSAQGPTPGKKNAAFATNLPPVIRQVDNKPQQPHSGDPVRITAKVTDSDGVQNVTLQYQLVDPGAYIALADPAYQTNWTSVQMNDAGSDGDEKAGDDIFTVTLPPALQKNRRLIRYRIVAADSGARSVRVPYSEDAQPNFAYFVYDGVPSWRGAIHPGDADQTKARVTDYSSNVMSRLPVYHLITKAQSVLDSQFLQRNSGNQFKWTGTIVSDGKVYDHISYRPRGGVWRYAMGKNAWKWSFTHNHHFEMRDNYGHAYNSPHSKLNIRPLIQQGDYLHRGEQGMFESVTLRMFNMLGVPGSRTTWFQFRIVDDAAEYGPSQYDGDFWGLYLAVEEGDGDFLKEHNLADGNFYMMRDSFGTKQNQGRTSTPDSSDLSTFINTYKGSPTTSWWRTNLDLQEYYSYRTVLEAVHHYDVDDPPGKNYEYYHNSVTGLWSVHPWDMDLTWADNMYGGGNEPFRDRVAQNANQPELNIEFKNRIREIRDLLFNTDQMNQLIDEYANIVHGPAGLSITDADRAQWDYNPILVNSSYGVDPNSKGGWGKFYQFSYEQPGISNSFFGAPQLMKKYVVKRMARLDTLSADTARPAKPQITSLSPATFPINKLSFRASAYGGSAAFAGMKWRVGEITPANSATFDPFAERKYEVESAWESPEFSAFNSDFTFPSSALKVGHTYRARVKMKDAAGRWSNWSDPIEFAAGEVDNLVALSDNLRVTELMYNPAGGSDFEFIELHNQSSSETLDLSGVKFTQGIDYTFTNTTLAPGGYLLLTRAPDSSAFRAFYNLRPDVQVYGPYTGKLDNAGETVTIKTATGSSDLISFLYSNNRGWSIAADGGGHSLIPKDSAIANETKGSLNYGGNWRSSTLIKGSPGQADPLPQTGILINEFAANTAYSDPAHPEYNSNDWIEFYNAGNGFESFDAMFLSDDVTQLKKWDLPLGGLAPGQRIVFDEVTGFHSPTNSGFGLNSSGEQLVLSYLPGNANDRILDAFSFKAQEPGLSLSRLPDGEPYWFATKPTRNLPNSQPIGSIVISELMYHPKPTAAQLEDNAADEFVELFNPTPAPINLFNNVGTWSLDGGVNFIFPPNLVLNPGKTMLVINLNPTNTPALNAFKQTFGITDNDVAIVGPYTGKLGNSNDKIALEKPQAPSVPGDSIASVIVDEATYSNLSPWPEGADATGKSITRINPKASGNDPANWNTTTPTPGSYGGTVATADTDHDGMPDAWELVHGFDPNDARDALLDADGDGMTNLQEYLASTDPRDSTSRLSLTATASTSNGISLSFKTAPGMGYVIEYATDLGTNSWTVFLVVDPQTQAGELKASDAPTGTRFYRVRLIR